MRDARSGEKSKYISSEPLLAFLALSEAKSARIVSQPPQRLSVHVELSLEKWTNSCHSFRSFPVFFYLSALYSISRPRAAAGICSEVTGGRPVLTSTAVGGGAPGPLERSGGGNREGVPSPTRSCVRSDQAGSLGTKEETPAAARHRNAKVHFQMALLDHMRRLLAPKPICFGESPVIPCIDRWCSLWHSGRIIRKSDLK
jgi:hypothetical protein